MGVAPLCIEFAYFVTLFFVMGAVPSHNNQYNTDLFGCQYQYYFY